MSHARATELSNWDCAGCGLPLPIRDLLKPCSFCGSVIAVPNMEE